MALEPLTTGQLLDKTFQLYRKHFLLFAGIAVVPPALSGISQMALGSENIAATIAGLFGMLLYLAALGVGQAATCVAVADVLLGRPTGIGLAYKRVVGHAIRYLAIILGLAIIVGLGVIALVIPGVYFLITYSLAIVASANEDIGFTKALKRSKELVKGNRSRISLIYLLSLVITYACVFGLTIPAVAASASLMESSPMLANAIVQLAGVLAGMLSTPIGLIGFTLAYYDARVRKEAFDLQVMMEQSGVQAMSASAGA